MKTLLKTILIVLGALAILVIGIVALIYTPSPKFEPVTYEPITPDYWPTEGWQTSTPEEQGMDSEKLLEMMRFYEEKRAENELFRIDSMTIIRNGYIVADIYPNPLYPTDSTHIMHSCTKSLMGALIGIAIEKGYLENVDVPICDIFADHGYQVTDERMKDVTVKHLLAMHTGIRTQDDIPHSYRGLFEVQATEDWVEAVLSLPLDVEPGVRFDYSNLASFMLGAVIQKTSGMDTLSFAREYLFDPLGIEEVQWERNPQGYYITWARMWLKPHDMAKIGLLWLQKGKWDETQIIPADWVKDSITPHSYPKNYHDILDENGEKDAEASQRNWVLQKFIKPYHDGYGYQIWLDRSGSFAAMGASGQYIIVSPEENLVVVFTSKLTGLDTFVPVRMFKKFILPAIISDEAITANEAVYDQLAQLLSPTELTVDRSAVPELPGIAMDISGVTYQMEKNDWRYDNFQLVFDPAWDYAEFNYTAKDGKEVINMLVGLDNVHRFADTNDRIYAAVGSWSAPNTFTVDYEVIGYSTQDRWNLTVTEDGISVEEINELTGVKTYTGVPQ